MPYDPDGDPDALDLNNPDDVDAYLDDPVAQALVEDLGREFRSRPAVEQVEDVAVWTMQLQRMRDELREAVDGAPGEDPRRALLKALETQLVSGRARLAELRDHPPT